MWGKPLWDSWRWETSDPGPRRWDLSADESEPGTTPPSQPDWEHWTGSESLGAVTKYDLNTGCPCPVSLYLTPCRYFCYFLENYLHILWLIPIQHSARRVSKTSLGATPSYLLCNWTCFLFSWNIWLASQECRSHTGRLAEQTQHQSIINQWNLEQITSEMQIIKINTRQGWVTCYVMIENLRKVDFKL